MSDVGLEWRRIVVQFSNGDLDPASDYRADGKRT